MIHTPFSGATHTCTEINFRGFRISIAMDDRSRGNGAPLTRTSLAVYDGEKEVTRRFAGGHATGEGVIEECTGEELFHVMLAIADAQPGGIVEEEFMNLIVLQRASRS